MTALLSSETLVFFKYHPQNFVFSYAYGPRITYCGVSEAGILISMGDDDDDGCGIRVKKYGIYRKKYGRKTGAVAVGGRRLN